MKKFLSIVLALTMIMSPAVFPAPSIEMPTVESVEEISVPLPRHGLMLYL